MEEWSKTDPNDRKAAEEKMRGEWGNWMSTHSKMIISTDVGGKTKRVTSSGISETKNDIILYSIVEAESDEAAAKACENHPHFRSHGDQADGWNVASFADRGVVGSAAAH